MQRLAGDASVNMIKGFKIKMAVQFKLCGHFRFEKSL